MLEQFYREHEHIFWKESWAPSVDIYESDEAFIILVELAGVNPDAVELDLIGNSLVIKGERYFPVEENILVHRMEIHSGPFEREIILPEEIDEEKVKATWKEGLLVIRLPKKVKKIKVLKIEK